MPKEVAVGIFTSDWQLSENPPVARSVEGDWVEVQRGYVSQLRRLQEEHGCSVFIAGDLFEKWNSSPYLISHVIAWLRGMAVYAIPGNHDLPHHSYQQLSRSAYWTLVEAGAIRDLPPQEPHCVGNLIIHPFPYGFKPTPPVRKHSLCLTVALIHDYVWTEKAKHPQAPETNRYGVWKDSLKDYDCAAFGDNHKGFASGADTPGCKILNCGTLLRRHVDEKAYRPAVGLLMGDGTWRRHYLDTSKDRFLDPGEAAGLVAEGLHIDLADFAAELSDLHAERFDFCKAVIHLAHKHNLPPEVKAVLWRAIGAKRAHTDRQGR